MKLSKVEKLLVIITILVAILIAIIVYIVKNGTDIPIFSKKNNATDNSIKQNVIEDPDNSIDDLPDQYIESTIDVWEELNKISQEDIKLERDDSIYTYFLMKQCLEKYYNAENYETVMDILDKEAEENLNITYENITNFYDDYVKTNFCIDKIYKQRTNPEDSSQNLYVVYHRIGNMASKIDRIVFVKIEERNVCFSIYPYEYLQKYNYLNLSENDVVTINKDEVLQNDNNNYKSNSISVSTWSCTKELYDRYKFDIQFDVGGLYNKLDEQYRNIKFSNYEDFATYVNNTKQEELDQKPEKYLVTDNGEAKEFIALCGEDNYYIFSVKNLMEYTIILDDYTILSYRQNINYRSALPAAQVRYCIGRVIKAINDKNYEFIYQKLNPVQKSNYYSNYEDLKNFIIDEFYNKNNYEIEKKSIMVSSNVYQYTVKLTDAEVENTHEYKKFVMTVTLKDNEDFYISINK